MSAADQTTMGSQGLSADAEHRTAICDLVYKEESEFVGKGKLKNTDCFGGNLVLELDLGSKFELELGSLKFLILYVVSACTGSILSCIFEPGLGYRWG